MGGSARRRGGAGAELREDLVDHRGLGDVRDNTQGPRHVGHARGVDLEHLLQERRPPGVASVRLRRGAGTMASGASTMPGSA